MCVEGKELEKGGARRTALGKRHSSGESDNVMITGRLKVLALKRLSPHECPRTFLNHTLLDFLLRCSVIECLYVRGMSEDITEESMRVRKLSILSAAQTRAKFSGVSR